VFVCEVLVLGVILLLNRRTADTPKQEGARLDLVGTALSALGLGLIVYGVLRLGTWGFAQPKQGAPTWLGSVAGDLADPRRGRRAVRLPRLGEVPPRLWRSSAARPGNPAGPPAPHRPHLLLLPVPALEAGAGPEIITWPMILAGFGIGALASQLGAITVGSVPDEQSGEVGGLQNTASNLGISIGTALAGAVLISVLTTSFFTGVANNPAVPEDLTSKAQVELTSGVPFISDADLEAALADAGVTGDTDPATDADEALEATSPGT
jgi:hypothetical protein